MALYVAEPWTLRKAEQKYLESSKMWLRRRMEKISWNNLCKKKKKQVLHTVEEDSYVLTQ